MRFQAALVHLFTALGAVAALMAALAIAERQWEVMFAWLGIAFIIDGVDGTFARWVKVDEHLPRFSGERLDLVVDYLTYVFIPALALLAAGHLSGATGLALAAGILLSSLFHFADLESKAEDHSFVGFPAVWNIVALYLFVLQASETVAVTVIGLCVLLAFVPMKWVHPFRVVRLRFLTIVVTLAWAGAAIAAVLCGFAAVPWAAKTMLLAAAAYMIGLSIASSKVGW